MDSQTINHPVAQDKALTTNKVLRNTYSLLSLTLLFSAVTAGVSLALNLPHPGLLLTLAGYFGLLFAVTRTRNSGWGLLWVFALTGFMGMTLGPILNAYLSLPGGSQIVMTAMAGTATIFMALSLRDQQHYSRRRDQLHHGDRHIVRCHFQSVYQPAAPAWCAGR